MALAVAHVTLYSYCIRSYTRQTLRKSDNKQEIIETI